MAKSTDKKSTLEIVEPIGQRVLIRKDEDRKITKVGIHLPDKIEIPTLTGRIVAVSEVIENDPDYPIQQYDKVLFNPKQSIPVDFEGDNRLFVIPIEELHRRCTQEIGGRDRQWIIGYPSSNFHLPQHE